MASADDSGKSVLEFLEQLRTERDELTQTITMLEKRLGISAPNHPQATPSNAPKVKVSIGEVPVGYFHNLSQPQAAEKLLRLNPGQPLTTQEMINAFRRSGLTLNPKNAATILYTALSRNGRFERVAGKAWGLAEWYPDNKRRAENKRHGAEQSSETDDAGPN
jgi:hypothetical protein